MAKQLCYHIIFTVESKYTCNSMFVKLRSQPAEPLFVRMCWVGRGKNREDAHHIHGCARCKYMVRTQRLGESGCVYRTRIY